MSIGAVLRMALLAVVLLLVPFDTAWNKDLRWWDATDSFALWIAETPVDPIPAAGPGVPSRGMTDLEFAAYLADLGNGLFKRVRETQADYFWYGGRIEPLKAELDASLETPVIWPDGTVFALRLRDGRLVGATEAIGMLRFARPGFGVPRAQLFPRREALTFGLLLVENRYKRECPVYVGFPRSFDPEEVVGAEFVSARELRAEGRRETSNEGGM